MNLQRVSINLALTKQPKPWRAKNITTLVFFCLFSFQKVNADAGFIDLMQLNLDELLSLEVTSSSFFEADAADVPGYHFVIAHDEMRKSAQRTLKEILQVAAPGFYVTTHSHWGEAIGVRGLAIGNSTKTVVMNDGQNLNVRSNLGYMMGLKTPLFGDIERMEISNGPGAMLHGRGAINGFINNISKNGNQRQGLSLDTGLGPTNESYRLELGYGLPFGAEHDLYLYAGVHGAEGFVADKLYGYDGFILEEQNKVQAVYDLDQRYSAYYRKGKLTGKLFYNETNPSVNNYEHRRRGFLHFAQLGGHIEHAWELSSYESLLYRNSFLLSEVGAIRLDDPLPNMPPFLDIRGSRERNGVAKLTLLTQRFENHNIALGTEWVTRKFERNKWFFMSTPDENAQGTDGKWREASIFAEDIWHLNKKWALVFGLRYDTTNAVEVMGEDIASANNTTRRGGITYKWTPKTTLKLSYQEGFRYPDALNFENAKGELVESDSGDPIIQPRVVRPESMDSIEANLNTTLYESDTTSLNLSLNIFYNDYQDSIKFQEELPTDPVGVGRGFANATDKLTSTGNEWIIELKTPGHQTKLIYSYAHLSVEDLDWLQHPEHTLKLWWEMQVGDRISIISNLVYLPAYDTTRYPASEYFNHSSVRLDSALNFSLNEHLNLQLSFKNIGEADTPAMNVVKPRPWAGNLGDDKRVIHLSLSGHW